MTAWPYPRWVAHRGAGKLAPENTLSAFRLGASHGYRMFECDAKLSSDGVIFLMHDATLDRTTSGAGIGGDKPWSELSQLDSGGWHSRQYAGEPLPTLQALARWCIANGHFFNIEIKPTPGTDLHTGREVARQAAAWWSGHTPPLLTSFRTESLQGALEVAPHLPRGLLLDTLPADWLACASSLQCQAIVCNHALWTRETVAQAKAAGFKCLSYTVNDAWAAQRLLDLGTDAIITDRVDLFPPV
jgi:glycerophosphoryl diester phosphodiesterase